MHYRVVTFYWLRHWKTQTGKPLFTQKCIVFEFEMSNEREMEMIHFE